MPLTHREVRRHPLWGATFSAEIGPESRHNGRAWYSLLALGLVLLIGALTLLATLD